MSIVEKRAASTLPGGVTGKGFAAGVSGNPGGRPKGLARRVRELVGDDGAQLANYLLRVVNDDRERTRDRLEAVRLLCDRGWGKPTQSVDVEVAQRGLLVDPQAFADTLTGEELDTMIALMEKCVTADSPPAPA